MDKIKKIAQGLAQNLKKVNNLSLPVVILISSIILGGFFYASQVSKQQFIEKQQQIKITQDKQEQLAKELKEQEAKDEAERALNACLATADELYTYFWEKECKGQGKLTSCNLPSYISDRVDKSLQDGKAECFKRYPQK